MSLRRRDFLKITGAASLNLSLYAGEKEASLLKSWLTGIERWIPTVCCCCPGGCGILVRVIDDQAVKIEGNPLHPLNRGTVCPKGQAGLQLLYHPERIKKPLRKKGDGDSMNWQEISWEEALDLILSQMKKLREEKSHTVAFLSQDLSGTTKELINRFFTAYGTPNFLQGDEWITLKEVHRLSQGINDLLSYDLENAKYILSFGADFLTNWPTSIENQRIYGEKRSKGDCQFIQVEPRFSLCASRADRWVPLKPGTEGYLALAIASVIIREKLYDKAYLDRFTLHFEKWKDEEGNERPGLKDLILGKIRLDEIVDLTGVPLKTIIEIAKEFATSKPSLAIADYQLSFQENGLFHGLAIHCLNALVGNIDKPGGVLRQRKVPLKEFPPIELDEKAKIGLSQPIIDLTAENNPYEINCLFLRVKNSFYSTPLFKKAEKIIRHVPFKVSLASFPDEICPSSDLVLPLSTFFEKWHEVQASPLSKIPVIGVGQPIIKPLYETKPIEEIFFLLAQKMGNPVAGNFPWKNFQELLFWRFEGLYQAQKGCLFTSPLEEAQVRTLEERGWWQSQHDSLESFLNDLIQKGGWFDPAYHFNQRDYIYQTSSKRFHFSPLLEFKIPVDSHPVEKQYPFKLYLYDLPFTIGEDSAHFPWHQETLGFRFQLHWKTWVEINPQKARELKIKDKDLVWVESATGRIQAIAKLFPGVAPDVVAIPLGKKEKPLGKAEEENQNNPFHLLAKDYRNIKGIFPRNSTRVRIYKVGGKEK